MEPRVLRLGGRSTEAEVWALALASAGISSRIEPIEGRFAVLVDEPDEERGRAVLDAYDAENPPEAPLPPVREHGPSLLGPLAAIALVAFWQLSSRHPAWVERGVLDAERLLAGEWWRALTALTLHADFAHVLGNAIVGLIFLDALAVRLGPGVAAWLALAGGAAGNLLDALAHHSSAGEIAHVSSAISGEIAHVSSAISGEIAHVSSAISGEIAHVGSAISGEIAHGVGFVSLGASTAVFAALGALASLQARAPRPRGDRRRAVFRVAAATLALLGMIGVSPKADVLAHLFGLLCGALAGLLASLLSRPPGRAVQWPLVALALAALAAAWLRALA